MGSGPGPYWGAATDRDGTTLARPFQDTGKVPGQVNYQIAASRVGPLLINIQTGATWLLSRDPAKDEAYWWPIQPQSGVVVPGE